MVNHFTDILIITHNFLMLGLFLSGSGSVVYNRKPKITILKIVKSIFLSYKRNPEVVSSEVGR